MSYTFNIADLHGRSDLAKLAIDKISEYITKHDSVDNVVVFTGDYIDRGPDSRGVIEYVMNLQKNAPQWKVVALKGNHETFMLEAQNGIGIGFWTTFNGGDQTYKSYGLSIRNFGKDHYDLFPQDHIDWVANLPLYYDDGKRLYVHAGIANYDKPLTEQTETGLLWMLYGQKVPYGEGSGLVESEAYDITGNKHWDDGVIDIDHLRHVVHGHHQFKDGPKLFTNRSNFDTLAWWTGRLVVGVFDNNKVGGPVDTIEIQGRPISVIKGLID